MLLSGLLVVVVYRVCPPHVGGGRHNRKMGAHQKIFGWRFAPALCPTCKLLPTPLRPGLGLEDNLQQSRSWSRSWVVYSLGLQFRGHIKPYGSIEVFTVQTDFIESPCTESTGSTNPVKARKPIRLQRTRRTSEITMSGDCFDVVEEICRESWRMIWAAEKLAFNAHAFPKFVTFSITFSSDLFGSSVNLL